MVAAISTRSRSGGAELRQAATSLTAKQEAFAVAYIRTLKASDAYREAYQPKNMSPKTINEAASRLLTNSKVVARIDELRTPALVATGIEVEDTLRRIAQINRFDIRKLYDTEGNLKPIHLWDDDTAAAISHIGRNGPVPFDKGRSLEMSMKHLGMYEKDNSQKGENLKVQILLVGPRD